MMPDWSYTSKYSLQAKAGDNNMHNPTPVFKRGYACYCHHPLTKHLCMNYMICSYYNHVGPSWLKNLYFAYLLVVRAITKMEPYWMIHQFYTGNESEDGAVNELVQRLIHAAK